MNVINDWNSKIKNLEHLLAKKYDYDDVELARTQSNYIKANNLCKTFQDKLYYSVGYYEHLLCLKEAFEK